MRSRAEVIYQAALVVPPWLGINPGSAKPVDQIAGRNRIRTIGPAAAELQPTRGLLSRRLALRDHNKPPGRRDTEARFEREIEALAAMRGIVVAHGPRQRSEIEREIEARSANVYAGFFLRQLQPDMLVLDCGCGTRRSRSAWPRHCLPEQSSASISQRTAWRPPAAMLP